MWYVTSKFQLLSARLLVLSGIGVSNLHATLFVVKGLEARALLVVTALAGLLCGHKDFALGYRSDDIALLRRVGARLGVGFPFPMAALALDSKQGLEGRREGTCGFTTTGVVALQAFFTFLWVWGAELCAYLFGLGLAERRVCLGVLHLAPGLVLIAMDS